MLSIFTGILTAAYMLVKLVQLLRKEKIMAFSSLTLTRDDIDAFEGETFRDLNVTASGTTVGLSIRDTLVLDKAKSELQTDILEKLGHLCDRWHLRK